MQILVKYHCDKLIRLEHIEKGNWIDLRSAEDISLKKGETRLISLGVSMKLPKGYEAHIAPRSSTYKNWGIIQTNSLGIIDNNYSGTHDIWKYPVYALRDTEIKINDRICQFRIIECMPKIIFSEVQDLDIENRGGFGSTGKD